MTKFYGLEQFAKSAALALTIIGGFATVASAHSTGQCSADSTSDAKHCPMHISRDQRYCWSL